MVINNVPLDYQKLVVGSEALNIWKLINMDKNVLKNIKFFCVHVHFYVILPSGQCINVPQVRHVEVK